MFLGELIKDYREKNKMSMEEFASKAGLSKGYISMLEKNKHPKAKSPIAPSLSTFNKVASAMKIPVDDLIKTVDGNQQISLTNDTDIINMNSILTKKDTRDIKSILSQTAATLQSQEGLMFDGEPASEEAIQSILSAMEFGMTQAALLNKKYTPKKYRSGDENDDGKEPR